MASRILVTGRYIDSSTYVLYKEDGSEYMTIKEGQAFWIDNQFRPFHPIKMEKYSGRGTILMCQKFGNKGHVIEEFPLVHNKRGLWALTSGAARNGVFHTYYEPKTLLEKQLASMGVSRKLIENVEKIDVELVVGGQLCSHTINKSGYGCITDGKREITSLPEYERNHFNQYHNGCAISTHHVRIYDATYAIHYRIGTRLNGTEYVSLQKIYITPQADENEVVNRILDLKR